MTDLHICGDSLKKKAVDILVDSAILRCLKACTKRSNQQIHSFLSSDFSLCMESSLHLGML